MAVRRITLDKYLIEARRISAHRTKQAEKGIRRTYKKVLKEMNHFLADTYVKHAKNDTLTYAMLQQQNEYANFMDTIQKKVDGILPDVQKQIQETVKETYKNAYNGMIKAVETATTTEKLHANLTGIEACRPETIKRAVENPISGLTLKDRLEKNRKNVVYDIKQQIGVGLANGDRYTTMAERVSECLDGDYQKAVRVVRTETHRVEEAGNLDASLAMEDELNLAGMATTKTWITMDDVRVRHGKKANHVKMEGKTIPINEMFDLGRGIKAMSPGNSGDAANDIHCRCFLTYELEDLPNNDEDVIADIKSIIPNTIENKVKQFDKGLDNIENDDLKVLLQQSRGRTKFKKAKDAKSKYVNNEHTVYLAKDCDVSTVSHELFHEIDYTYKLTENGLLSKTIRSDYRRIEKLAKGYGKSIEEMLYSNYPNAFTQSSKGLRLKREYRGISDILNGMSNGEIRLGYYHSKDYWKKLNSLEKETWAQFGRILYSGNKDVIEMTKFIAKDSYDEALRTLKEMMK